MKQSFIFYRSFYEAIRDLPDKKRLKIYEMIIELGLNNVKIDEKDATIKSLFALIEPVLTSNYRKYENGQKGGRPRKTDKKEVKVDQKNKTTGFENKEPMVSQRKNHSHQDNISEDDVEEDVDVEDDVEVEEEVEEDIKNLSLLDFVEKTFGRTLGSTEVEDILTWKDNELTRYAIKQAELSRAFNVRYIEKIMFNYEKEGIKTVAEAEERDKNFRESKTTFKKPDKFSQQEEAKKKFLGDHYD